MTEREMVLFEKYTERKHKLNADFEWTDENKIRFLKVNDELFAACEKGWNEALKIANNLEERIKNNDTFFKDYEIKAVITPYPKIENDAIFYLAEEALRYSAGGIRISHRHYEKCISEIPFALDKSNNWNGEYFNGNFDNDYICYFIHEMLDTHVWSFPDILSIDEIWVEVRIQHQHC